MAVHGHDEAGDNALGHKLVGVLQQQVARRVPLDRLLLETDAPFLTPVPWRGRKNLPEYVLYTGEKVAELKGISLAELAQATTANARAIFSLITG